MWHEFGTFTVVSTHTTYMAFCGLASLCTAPLKTNGRIWTCYQLEGIHLVRAQEKIKTINPKGKIMESSVESFPNGGGSLHPSPPPPCNPPLAHSAFRKDCIYKLTPLSRAGSGVTASLLQSVSGPELPSWHHIHKPRNNNHTFLRLCFTNAN